MEGLLSAAGCLRRTAVLLQGRGERRKNKEKVKFMEKYWDRTGDVLGLDWGCTGDVLELFGDSWGLVCLNLPASYCFVIAVCRCF